MEVIWRHRLSRVARECCCSDSTYRKTQSLGVIAASGKANECDRDIDVDIERVPRNM